MKMQFPKKFSFIDDYELVPGVDAKGRTRQTVRYIGPYHWFVDGEGEVKRRLIAIRALTAGAVLLTLVAMFVPHGADNVLYVMGIMMLNLFPLAYIIAGAARLPFKIEPMKRDSYAYSIKRMQTCALGLLLITAAGLIGNICHWIFVGGNFSFGDVIFIVCALGSCCICYIIYHQLKSIKTELKPNDSVPKRD
ncbi:MAG: hypothetical protein Q4C04_05385 [Clostridia bacterium]|nr:hypothetical protein [Clostridia bacterium]